MTLGDTRRVGCPYYFCSAVVAARMVQPRIGEAPKELIPEHEVQHPKLRGVCVASLMYIPLDEETRSILLGRQRTDTQAIYALWRKERKREEEIFSRDASSIPESQSLRGSHRLGREPATPEDEEDFKFSGHELGPETNPIEPPAGGYGEHLGGRVAGVDDLAGLIQSAALKGGEVIATIQQMDNLVEQALGSLEAQMTTVSAANQSNRSQLLSDYASILGDVDQKIQALRSTFQEITNEAESALNKGETLIGRLFGGE